VPRSINPTSINHIERFLKGKRKLFIKPRCGSMGKGMTYLEKNKWQTNFDIRGSRIVSMRSDYGWEFRDVTGNSSFLKKLLEKDVIVEEAIDPFKIKGNMVDFRIYGFLNKILYIYPRKNKTDSITTNISQGGKGAPGIRSFLSKNTVKKIEEQTLSAMKALGLNFVGLDIMLNKNKSAAYVLDVNMFPGFPKMRTYNLARSLISELSKYH
jgi:glutathione synthase/RimK-type ligase-like ATP-grasp enzyme